MGSTPSKDSSLETSGIAETISTNKNSNESSSSSDELKQNKNNNENHVNSGKQDRVIKMTKSRENQDKTDLTGFPLVQHKCRKYKFRYDRCYDQFYTSSFLGLSTSQSKSPLQESDDGKSNVTNQKKSRSKSSKKTYASKYDCDDLFEKYRKCIYVNMKREREKQGLGVETLSKGSALRSFLEEEGEVDDEN